MKEFNHIYFIGIGGISMSSLAELMLDERIKISGSDRTSSHITKKLQSLGIKVNLSHDASNITEDIDLVVYTSAISDDNPELLKAQELNLKLMDRAEFLGLVMRKFGHAICVSGTHGKTTTTGMLSSVLIETDMAPTIFLGGEMDSIGGNFKKGNYNLLITEACEYKRNFLKFSPTMEIILNIEEDHLDYYKDLKDIENAFEEYANIIPADGHLIVNEKNKDIFKNVKCKVVTFGLDADADYYADNINNFPAPTYDLMHKGKKMMDIKLQVFGEHNILNSTAVAAACLMLGIEEKTIQKGLENFKGTHRRYEYKCSYNGAAVIDDYAHHPTEMKTTLNTARNYCSGNIITVFQPHTYTRTISLLDDFAKALKLSDKTILLDIYAAREKDTGVVHSKDILNKLLSLGADAVYAESFEKAAQYVKDYAKDGDTIITMGAGNVNETIDFLN